MWKSRLKCGLLCKNEIVTIFLLVFFIKLLIETKPIVCALGNFTYKFSREKLVTYVSRGRFEHELA